jgi:hypothetical protein
MTAVTAFTPNATSARRATCAAGRRPSAERPCVAATTTRARTGG